MARKHEKTSEQFVAERLFAAHLLTKLDYEAVLTELSNDRRAEPRRPHSAMHVIYRQGFRNAPEMLASLAKDSGMPLVPLARFAPQQAAFSLLGPAYAVARGALPFEMIDGELMVAVLNPYNTLLQTEAQQLAGLPCLFYLACPDEYDAALDTLTGK